MKYITVIIKKMQENNSKKLILQAVALAYKKYKNKSNYLLSLENGISTSLLNLLERGKKDPQLTTLFRLSQALNISVIDFIKEIEKNLPKDINLID